MKIFHKKLFCLFFVIIFAMGITVPCSAATDRGTLSVILKDKENNDIHGVTVSLCQIAELNSDGYHPVAAFEASGIALSAIVQDPDETAAKSVFDYVKKSNVSSLSKTAASGKVSFSDLDMGIFLVYCEEHPEYSFNPYFVFLPYESDGKLSCDISSSPKVVEKKPGKINVSVIKKWDDKNNAPKKRPSEISVDLLSYGKVISSALLSEENGWSFVFTDVPSLGEYSVVEKSVDDYRADYSGDVLNGFIITNTYVGDKLPQTGQYWWPIVILSIAGISFVLLGIYEFRSKKHEKKQ